MKNSLLLILLLSTLFSCNNNTQDKREIKTVNHHSARMIDDDNILFEMELVSITNDTSYLDVGPFDLASLCDKKAIVYIFETATNDEGKDTQISLPDTSQSTVDEMQADETKTGLFIRDGFGNETGLILSKKDLCSNIRNI